MWLGNVPGSVGIAGLRDRTLLILEAFPTNEAEREWLVGAIRAWLAANPTVESLSLTVDGEAIEIRPSGEGQP